MSDEMHLCLTRATYSVEDIRWAMSGVVRVAAHEDGRAWLEIELVRYDKGRTHAGTYPVTAQGYDAAVQHLRRLLDKAVAENPAFTPLTPLSDAGFEATGRAVLSRLRDVEADMAFQWATRALIVALGMSTASRLHEQLGTCRAAGTFAFKA